MSRDISRLFNPAFTNIQISNIVRVNKRAKELAPIFEKETGTPFIPFQRGDLNIDTPEFLKTPIKNAINIGRTNYPTPGAELTLKKAILEELEREGISGLDYENILCTHGGQEGLQLSCNLFNGAKAATFGPCWSCMIETVFPYTNIDFSVIPLEENQGQITFNENRLEKILPFIDLFYLNTPQNPSGKVFSREEMERLNYLFKKYDVFVLSDEPYKHIIFDGKKHVSMLEMNNENTIVVNSFSKSYAFTGGRIGYITSKNKEIISLLTKGQYAQTAGVATFIQDGIEKALQNREGWQRWIRDFVPELQERRDTIFDSLKDTFHNLYKPEGGFYFFLDFNPFMSRIQYKDDFLSEFFLEKKGLALVPGKTFGPQYEGYARISFAETPKDISQEGARRIREGVHEFKTY